MQKRHILAALISVATISSVNAMSVSPYIGGILGTTSYTVNSGNGSSTQSAGIGYGIFGGLGLTRHLAIDGAYTSYGKINNSDAYLSSLAIYLKGVLPINYQFHLFGKVGFANVSSHSGNSSNETGSGFAYAAGASYRIMNNVFILGQYQADNAEASGDKLEPSMWSLGLKYDFK
jgi:opacity protein-like surface antigen